MSLNDAVLFSQTKWRHYHTNQSNENCTATASAIIHNFRRGFIFYTNRAPYQVDWIIKSVELNTEKFVNTYFILKQYKKKIIKFNDAKFSLTAQSLVLLVEKYSQLHVDVEQMNIFVDGTKYIEVILEELKGKKMSDDDSKRFITTLVVTNDVSKCMNGSYF